MLKSYAAIGCWNILKYEIEGILDEFNFVFLKNKGNGIERNTCQKRSHYKITNKQTMWMIYRRTGNDGDYTNHMYN